MSLILDGTNGLSDVDGTAATPAIRGTDTNTGIFFPAADTIAFAEGGTEVARFDASGNLGIGTASPSKRLNVKGVTNTDVEVVIQANASNDYNSILSFGDNVDNSGLILYSNFSNHMRFDTNGTERMRITSAGNLCLGTTTKNNDGLVSISADSSANQGITIKETSAANNIYYIYFTNSAGSGAGRIEHTGSTTVSYVTSSDARLKTNIVDANSVKPVIDAIKIREFDWVSGEHQKFGVVAQELIDVAPEAVSVGRTDDDSWGVDYSKLVPHLIKYVQEQQAMITSLTARIAALENPPVESVTNE